MNEGKFNLIYKNESNRYRLGKEDCNKFHSRQFFYIYRARVEQLRERIIKNARKILSNESLTSTTIDYQKENNNVFLVGIVFKKMKFRQSVLYEFADDSNLKLKYTKKDDDNLVDESDLLELENNQQLIKLIGNIDKHSLVTGDVIGVYGSQARMDDTFKVEMMILPDLPPQIPLPIIEKDCYIAFISGISLAGGSEKTAKTIQALNRFQKWVNNELTLESHENTDDIVKNLIRLVIAGDFAQLNLIEIQRQKVAAIGLEYESNLDCFTGLDTFICSLLEKLSIDVMPGANDPTQCLIPQQPIPRYVFTGADEKKYSNFQTVTNPYRFSLGGLQFVGTSGQNLNDLARLTSPSGELDKMQRTLNMSNLFPTVPDTLSGFPFSTRDPLILEQLPHVYFCGNQNNFGQKLIEYDDGKRCLILTIPRFCETFEVALLNLRTLEVQSYSFKT
uniref:DNA polymerase delta small subunit n=1 Tax=Meloidogyne incognita TaxID=6306 RepID=A0A914KVY8_MELIC